MGLIEVNPMFGRIECEVEAEPFTGTSLDYLQAIYRDPRQPEPRRMRAAIAALPHEHPKLAVTAQVHTEGWGARLEAARERSAKVLAFRASERAEPASSASEILEPIRR
jgi:hypothetical protein